MPDSIRIQSDRHGTR